MGKKRQQALEKSLPSTTSPRTIRKNLLSALEHSVIPQVNGAIEVPFVWGAPPLETPPATVVRPLNIPPLPVDDRASHRFDQKWPAHHLNSMHFPYIAYLYEGEADLRMGVTTDMAQRLRILHPDIAVSGCYVMELAAPIVVAFPPGTPYSDGSNPHWERSYDPAVPARIFWMRILPAGVHCHLSRTYRTKLVSEHSLLIEDVYLPSMAAAFMNELQNRDDDYRNVAQAQFLALLWRLRRRLQNDVPIVANTMKSFEAPRQSAAHKVQLPSTMPPHQRAIFEKIDEYIGLHLQEPLTLMQLAEQAGLSLAQLNRLFHSACGTSVMRHVSQRRLYAACFLLEAHNLSVQEIARLCGYSHASHFCHVFAQEFHLTPLEYRRRHRQ